MSNYLKYAVFLLGIILINSCRTARQVSKTSTQPTDTIIQQIDSLPVIVVEEKMVIDSVVIVDTIAAIPAIDTISIIGVGDIMMGTNFPKASYLPPKHTNLLDSVKTILADADVTFGNLEGVILNEGGDPKNCKNPDACYLFRSPEYIAGNLKEAGFTVMSIANNHTGDFGTPGRKNTKKVLDSLQIHFAGTVDTPLTSFTVDGINYGFTAFSPNKGTVSIHDLEGAKDIVRKLDSLNDVVIVSFHGGAEGKDHEHITRDTETYYGENRGNVYEFSHTLVDAGADIIFGHGPHVTRAVEIYNERFIAYSLGNFCTYARFNLSGPNGIAPILKLNIDDSGKFLDGKIYPIKQIGSGMPILDKESAVIFKIQELTHIDFPEVKIAIDDDGNINYLDQDF